MADSSASWSRQPNIIDPNEKLFVFGYSCKIFRDDEKAMYIDQGKHLIPWMGDESLMIDRYDVRGYLHDLKQYEAKSENYEDPYSEEESLCDEERYRSLRTDMSEEQLYQEEELKRLRAAIAGDGAYHEISFSYDNNDSENLDASQSVKVEEPEDELYEVPEGLNIPKGMEVPYNMKIHAIIEKTANFVSEQGGQMEIIIKMKQHANPQFAFMHLDNPLYPYYKHLVKEIKSGLYKPVQTKKDSVSQSEDDDEDDHYLHPSLMAGKQQNIPKFTVPNINFRRSNDDSYLELVRSIQQQHRGSPSDSPQQDQETSEENGTQNNGSITCPVQPPPSEIRPIIDKMAEYVAKNGEDFETIVKTKNDQRFSFLHPWHEFYPYYLYKRNVIKALMADQRFSEMEAGIGHQNPQNLGQPYLQENSAYAQAIQSPVVRESGPVLYTQQNMPSQPMLNEYEPYQPDLTKPPPTMVAPMASVPTVSSNDFQNPVPRQGDSLVLPYEDEDSSDSSGSEESVKQEPEGEKLKPLKMLKAPISFSLKPRDSDSAPEKKVKPLLLMDDSEEEEDAESARRSAPERDTPLKGNFRNTFCELNPPQTEPQTESKTARNPEEMEAKQAEDRKKDKLFSATRERLAQHKKESQQLQDQLKRQEQLRKDKLQQADQQRRDKQLQLERKRKAELFLQMLKKKNPESVVSHFLASSGDKPRKSSELWNATDARNVQGPGAGLMYASNALRPEESSDTASDHSGPIEPISLIGEKLSSDPEAAEAEKQAELLRLRKKIKKLKKLKRRSPGREEEEQEQRGRYSREEYYKRRSSRRSPSPSRNMEKDQRELPAAYSFKPRSRSRSRSPAPRRYPHKPYFNYNHWNRRR